MTKFFELLDLNARHLWLIVPELLVMTGFLLGLVLDCVLPEARRKTTAYICLVFLVGALFANMVDWNALVHERPVRHTRSHEEIIFVQAESGTVEALTHKRYEGAKPAILESKPIFSGMLARDGFAMYFKLLLLLGTSVSIIMALHAKNLVGPNRGEFFLLLTATCLGGMFLSSATNLLMIYLSLEALSVISYALAGYLKQDRKSAEAGIKYVIYGAMASGIMIFGMSYLYGLTGSLNLTGVGGVAEKFNELRHASVGAKGAYLAVLAMVFCGLFYKIAVAPFHYWSPDVYEGAPTTATGFFSVVPKAAGFAVLVRVLAEFFPLGYSNHVAGAGYTRLELALAVLAVLTMSIGNLAALAQSNAKRMLAYSSIAHAGYMLAGLSVLDVDKQGHAGGPAAVLFYLLVYLFMNLGAFLVLVALENARGSCELKDLRGMVRREPLLAVALVAFLFSLTGLPPLAGFTGKYLIMLKLADRGSWMLILFIGFNSVISLYYYMRLAKSVVIDSPEAEAVAPEPAPLVFNLLAVSKVIMLVVLFVFFKPVFDICVQVLEPLPRMLQ